MKHCPNAECRFVKAHGYAAEYRDGTVVCSDCGTTLLAGEPPPKPAPKPRAARAPVGPIGPLLVTLAVVLVAWAISLVPIPGVNVEALTSLGGDGLADRAQVGIATLGVMPVLSGFLLVELVALSVSRWSALRLTPEGRRVLTGTALRLGGVLALLQGFMVAVGLVRMSISPYGALVDQPGLAFVLIAMLTMAAGTAILVALASLIDRFGYGRGLVVLLVASYASLVIRSLALPWLAGEPLLRSLIVLAAAAAIAVGAWLWFAGAWRRVPQDGGALLRPPLSGLLPISISASVLMILATLATIFFPSAPVLTPGTTPYHVAAGSAVGLALFMGWLFARPKLVVGTWSRCLGGTLDEHAARFRNLVPRMHLVTCVIIAAIVFVDALLARGFGVVMTLSLIAITAGAFDVIEDLRAPGFVDVWPVTRPYALEPALRMLRNAGIDARVRSGAFYSLFPFTTPYAVASIAVPAARYADAEAQLRGALSSDEHPERAALEELFA